MGTVALLDTMLNDGLADAFGGYHLGIIAENVSARFSITREAQDALAFVSRRPVRWKNP